MIRWHIQGRPETVGDELPALVGAGWLHASCPVSADGGRTWMPALEAARRLDARGHDALAALVPLRTSGWAMAAQYLSLFSLLFFGGPLSFGALAVASDKTSTLFGRLAFALVALALGPAPIALMAWLGRREIARDPTLRGKGRLVFALICAGLMTSVVLVAIAMAPIRSR